MTQRREQAIFHPHPNDHNRRTPPRLALRLQPRGGPWRKASSRPCSQSESWRRVTWTSAPSVTEPRQIRSRDVLPTQDCLGWFGVPRHLPGQRDAEYGEYDIPIGLRSTTGFGKNGRTGGWERGRAVNGCRSVRYSVGMSRTLTSLGLMTLPEASAYSDLGSADPGSVPLSPAPGNASAT